MINEMGTITDRVKENRVKTDPFSRFEGALSADKNTRMSYIKELEGFRAWINLSYEDLYQLGVEASQSDDPADRLIVLNKLAEYIEHVQTSKVSETSGRKYSYGKLKLIQQSVLKFYNVNGISFKVDRSHKLSKLTKAHPSALRKPSKEEIRELIGICPNYRIKAAVALSKDSGLRVSDITAVRFKHIKDGLSSLDGFGGFILTTEKTDRVAMPCYGPEATKYLRYWVAEYERKLGRKLSDEDLIFPQIKNTNFTKLDANDLDGLINDQIARLGLTHQISANGLRYHFESSLETKLNKNIILKIAGKGIPDSTKSYSKHDIEELLSLYKPVYGALMVESTQDREIDKKIALGSLEMSLRVLNTPEEKIKQIMDEAGRWPLENFNKRVREMMRERY